MDPPDGRIPALTPEARERITAQREFRLALLQATATCRDQEPACAGWEYGPPSPLREEQPPYYNTDRLNRNDGPEDRSLSERCMGALLPDFSGYRRIVQSPDAVSIFYDVGQGQGWQRTIPITDRPHVPSNVRQWWGDSRGRWEDGTLVVDVTNFSPKTDYRGSRENLRLVERWRRLDVGTLEYIVTVDDPTTWTGPWTVRQELIVQDGQANRIYYEPRCHEGQLRPAGAVGGLARRGAGVRRGARPGPGHTGHRDERRRHRRRRPADRPLKAKARTARLGGSGAGQRGPRKRTPGAWGAAPSGSRRYRRRKRCTRLPSSVSPT